MFTSTPNGVGGGGAGASTSTAMVPIGGAYDSPQNEQIPLGQIDDIARIAEREFPYQFRGNPITFASLQSKKKSGSSSKSPSQRLVRDDWEWMYRSINTEENGPRGGNIHSAFFLSVHVTSALNTFDTPIMVSAPGALPGNVYVGKQRGCLIIPPCSEPMSWGPHGKQIHFVNPVLYEDLFKFYGDVDLENLASGMPIGSTHYAVDVDSILGRAINHNAADYNFNVTNHTRRLVDIIPGHVDDPTRSQFVYVVPTGLYHNAANSLRSLLSAIKRPEVDLSKAKLRIEPMGQSWGSYVSSIPATQLGAAILKQEGKVFVSLATKYRLRNT
jgi:hypothetical protein